MADMYYVELGVSIAHYRKLKGYTQQMLADRMRVTRGTIANWETARREMNIKEVRELCEVLGVTPDDLLRNSEKYLWRDVQK